MRITGFLVYCVIGLLIHYIAYDITSMSEAFTYIFMVFWPFILFWWALKWAVIVVVVLIAIAAVYRGFSGHWPWDAPMVQLNPFRRRNHP